MIQIEEMAQSILVDSIMQSLRENRLVAVLLDGFPDRIAVHDALESGGVLTIQGEQGFTYKVRSSSLKAVITLQEEPRSGETGFPASNPSYNNS